jgi:hypothetical protein
MRKTGFQKARGNEEIHAKFRLESIKGRGHSEDLGIDEG